MEENKAVSVNFGNIGLGNVMWKIASAYGIAMKRNANCYLGESLKKWQDISGFCGPFPVSKPTTLENEYYISEKSSGCFEERMFKENLSAKHVRVGTYLQSRKYFSHCENDIINMYQPKESFIDEANNWFRSHNINEDDSKICIHIRGGDMKSEVQTMPDNEWFQNAISKMPSSGKVIIFSDDFEFVKSFPVFSNTNYIFAEKNSMMLDFTLMTQCSHFILSRGTFSWWAAFLSKTREKVIYHDEFVNTEYENHFVDYYPSDWEQLVFKYTDVVAAIDIKPVLSTNDHYDLINYYFFSIKTQDIDINYISKLCCEANSMWKFHITHVTGNFKSTYKPNWTLSINNTRKLVIILALNDDSTLDLHRETSRKITMTKNQLYIFPSYLLYKCHNVAIFYAVGDSFR